MIILVCGNQDWNCIEDISIHIPHPGDPDYGPHTYIHGGARGADRIAGLVADTFGHTVIPYPVNTAIDGPWPQAGPRRNSRMLRDGKPDRGLAFGALYEPVAGAGSKRRIKRTGTGDMVSKILRAGLTVRWIAAPGAPALDLAAMPPGA